jgi:glycosyltransferase involved in cell wall biosynthesis
MTDAAMLTWSALIPTYNRHQVLMRCIECILAQTEPPKAIIVVDASDDWQQARAALFEHIGSLGDIEFHYLSAERKSSAAQRNQALRYATSDIVFFLDDDSLMHPECAAHVMDVYRADRDARIAGVQAQLARHSPDRVAPVGERKQTGYSSSWLNRPRGLFPAALRSWIEREVLMMSAAGRFIPYDGAYWDAQATDPIDLPNVQPSRLLQGCRMTFRREIIAAVQFDGDLLAYSAGEDLDASYRASRGGALVTATLARLYHFESAQGRLKRHQVARLALLNQAKFVRQHSSSLRRDRRRFLVRFARLFFAELLKDALSGRWSFPQLRGTAVVLPSCLRVLYAAEDAYVERYRVLQSDILFGRDRSDAAPANT